MSRLPCTRAAAACLLLHHNLINALFLGDVIRVFQDKGWTLIDPEYAYADPVYAMRLDTLPAGESVLWGLANERGIAGLRFPGEDVAYEKPVLDRLRL